MRRIGPLWDPIAVRIAFDAGEGARLRMRIGGKISPLSGEPLDLDCTVKALKRDMIMTGLAGSPTQMGDSALVEADGIEIVLITLRNQAMGTDMFTARLRPGRQEIDRGQVFAALLRLFLQSGKHVIYVAAPGSVTLDLSTLPFKKIQRPKPVDSIAG
jgi:microcystin degradation protein MlrC